MNSHIVLPKCILKQFQNSEQWLSYYDTVDKRYKTIRPVLFNTKENYYSDEVEKFLSETIETPLGRILRDLRNEELYQLPSEKRFVADNYLYALLVRSPKMANDVRRGLFLPSLFNDTEIAGITVVSGFKEAAQHDSLKEYTFYIIKSKIGRFVLPSNGYCTFHHTTADYDGIVVPISPQIAFFYYKGRESDKQLFIGSIDNMWVQRVNSIAFEQAEKVGGCLLANDLQMLKEIIQNLN